jgi:hypothetical protein
LSWASHYAVSDNVYGPYVYKGNTGASNDHGNFFEWNNQWFQSFTIYDPTHYFRASGLCYIHYKDNGEMVADQMIIEYGVGLYDANWNKIQAEWYMAGENIRKTEHPHHGFVVSAEPGGYLYFPNISNVPENARIVFFANCLGMYGAEIEIRVGGVNGDIIGECDIFNTRFTDWRGYRLFSCDLKNVAGDLDICFVFKGDSDAGLRLDWFRLYNRRQNDE